jgi:hypothetical protein
VRDFLKEKTCIEMDTAGKKVFTIYGTALKDLRWAVRMDPIILEGSFITGFIKP